MEERTEKKLRKLKQKVIEKEYNMAMKKIDESLKEDGFNYKNVIKNIREFYRLSEPDSNFTIGNPDREYQHNFSKRKLAELMMYIMNPRSGRHVYHGDEEKAIKETLQLYFDICQDSLMWSKSEDVKRIEVHFRKRLIDWSKLHRYCRGEN